MANLDFKKDLTLGNEGEKLIINFLQNRGCKYIDSNYDNKWDVKMVVKGKETTYEIKTDVKCAPLFDTGNLFIEYSSRGKLSGIAITQADWFVNYFPFLNEAWFIKSNKLKKLIKDNEFPTFKDAGDINSSTHGYLINREKFRSFFYVTKI
jgi:uncharacterized protein YuzE